MHDVDGHDCGQQRRGGGRGLEALVGLSGDFPGRGFCNVHIEVAGMCYVTGLCQCEKQLSGSGCFASS